MPALQTPSPALRAPRRRIVNANTPRLSPAEVRHHIRTALDRWGPGRLPPAAARVWLGHDLGHAQRVQDYRSAAAQKRYTHMYAAKHLGLWRAIRAHLDWDDSGRLVSIGAGPMLDAMGWCFDRPRGGRRTLAIDPLDWRHVRGHEAWHAAMRALCGRLDFLNGVYAPFGPPPPQLQALPAIRPMQASTLRRDDTVLMPFVVNHVLDDRGQVVRHAFERLGALLAHHHAQGGRLVIADYAGGDHRLWHALLQHLGLSRISPRTFRFQRATASFRDLYPPSISGYRTWASNPERCTAVVLAADPVRGWRFLEA